MKQFQLTHKLLQHLDHRNFDHLCEKWQMDKGVRKLTTRSETKVLILSGILGIRGLREIEESFGVPRSTLNDAIRKRPCGFFYDLCKSVANDLARATPTRSVRRALKLLFALDSTSICVNGRLSDQPVWGRCHKENRAAAKLTIIWDVNGKWVRDFRISGGFGSDGPIADQFHLCKGATYVFDRGYCDIRLWWKIASSGAHFVTRLRNWKRNRQTKERLIKGTEKMNGVLWDGPWEAASNTMSVLEEKYDLPQDAFRRVIYRDEESGRTFDFVTSDWSTPAQVIADIYKARWAVELAFRWFKGHLNLRYVDGRCKNAVKTQLAVALLTALLLQLEILSLKLKKTSWQLLRGIASYIRRNGLIALDFRTLYTPKPRRTKRAEGLVWEI